MPVDDVLPEALAEKQLRLALIERMRHEANQIEMELRQRTAHLVEAVLRLDNDLVEPVGQRPDFLFLGKGAKVPLSAPVRARPANPVIEHAPAIEFDNIFERG